jgi:phosphatidylserine/phosphatidylglycerophosphate/cardiolipin synthase-like enzyme
VVDGRYLLVGSMNLDPRSIELNTEIGLLINSSTLAGDVARLFNDVVQHNTYRVILADNGALRWVDSATNGGGTVREFDDEPQSSGLLRLTLKMLAPFAPEEML